MKTEIFENKNKNKWLNLRLEKSNLRLKILTAIDFQ